MKRLRNFATVLLALFFVTVWAPAEAGASTDEHHCYACEMCYDHTWGCTSCGVMTLSAITTCCGLGGGTAYCVPDYGGFAVNCEGWTKSCQCDMDGDTCDPLVNGG